MAATHEADVLSPVFRPTLGESAAPVTKFRSPRIRRDIVARPSLLDRLQKGIDSCPVTLICAPGGSGKTTLLTQFIQLAGPGATTLWISLDEDDNDRHQLFATLLKAVEPLQLAWETPPALLLRSAAGSESQCRAALAAFVNALCTAQARRIVLVLDDLHRLDRPDVFVLLESLVERLPDHVAMVLGSRFEPPLPLARWRAHGELAEFVPWDLQFTEDEAATFATSRFGSSPEPQTIRDVVRRTHGWAVGVSMVLQSRQRPGDQRIGDHKGAGGDQADRHLFAYFAQEIVADLPADVREFMLQSSILTELSPALCEAVTGRTDSQRILESLYRRNLFLTVLDENVPVLRFHDLFREFLQNELEQHYPAIVRTLHDRAGHAERALPRAITHLLKAERWDDAMNAIALHGEPMIATGDYTHIERWIDQIPREVRAADARMLYLRGTCAWIRWEWIQAKQELRPAVAGLTDPQHHAMRVRAMFLLVDALNSSGEGTQAWALLGEIAQLPLDDLARAQLALQRAWCVLPSGDPAGVARYMEEFLMYAERDPATICPQTADRIHCLCIGLPGIAACFERFFALSETVRGSSSAPWHLAVLPVGAWAQLWRGRRAPVQKAIERGETLHQQFGSMRLVSERMQQFRALYLAASGQHEAAEKAMQMQINALQMPQATAHRAVWLRAYQHALARFYWGEGNLTAFRDLAVTLLQPRVATEWPFLETAIELVRGQLAILREDWRAAGIALELSVQTHAKFRMPMSYGDPRISLAWMHHLQGNKQKAWTAFQPVLTEVLQQEAVGLLLLEPRRIVNALLDLTPAEIRHSPEFESLTSRLALWNPVAAEPAPAIGPLANLSEREQEVLARVAAGASNKHIARDLALSLHTVKRHIANILDKLDCTSRGQAADLFRRTS